MDIIYRYDPFAKIVPRLSNDPEKVIRALEEGHERYRTILRRVGEEISAGSSGEPIIITSNPLSLGFTTVGVPLQVPHALFLGCSDARAPIERIFDQSSNDLFVIRVAGNVLGTECLGSIEYAVQNLKESLGLLVVLGHSGCGALTAAVDGYLSPSDYPELGFTHALRSLVDRLQITVRGAAKALERVSGTSVKRKKGYRDALIETAVYLNAALTAFDVRKEIDSASETSVRVVYGVFDLADQRVRALPQHEKDSKISVFGAVPASSAEFIELGDQVAAAIQARRMI